MSFLESVFKKVTFSDNRRARRLDSPSLVAYYFDGATPTAHEIQNISADGFYMLTDDRLRPGTVVTMTLQMPSAAKESSSSKPHLTVMSMVVRQGVDGVGFAFIPNEPKGAGHEEESVSKPASRKAIGKFLEQIKSDGGHTMIRFRGGIPKQPPSRPNAEPAKPKAKPRRRFADESGQALIFSALAMTCLLGFAALATDVGVMMRQKRMAQTAADAAAVAGALELNFLGSGSTTAITSAAKAASALNGFTDGSNGVTVTINPPPLYGPHAGVVGYVEAIVTVQQPTIFMGFFGIANMTPTARAVATNGGGPSYGCVYVLAPTGTGMALQGKFDLSAPNCGLIIDSSDPSAALDFTGKAGDITAGSLGVVGGVSGSSNGTQPVQIVAASDPLSRLIALMPDPTTNPLKATCTVPNAGGKKGAGVLSGIVSPGGGTVCYSGDVTISGATLNAGTYVFTGNVTLDGIVITNGATLDLNSGSLQENTGTTLTFNPPGVGATFQGVSIMAPPTNPGPLNFAIGNATGTINGDIYAPGSTMTMQDNGGGGSGCSKGGLVLNTDLIVKVLDDTSACITINSFSQTNPGASLLTRIALVE